MQCNFWNFPEGLSKIAQAFKPGEGIEVSYQVPKGRQNAPPSDGPAQYWNAPEKLRFSSPSLFSPFSPVRILSNASRRTTQSRADRNLSADDPGRSAGMRRI